MQTLPAWHAGWRWQWRRVEAAGGGQVAGQVMDEEVVVDDDVDVDVVLLCFALLCFAC